MAWTRNGGLIMRDEMSEPVADKQADAGLADERRLSEWGITQCGSGAADVRVDWDKLKFKLNEFLYSAQALRPKGPKTADVLDALNRGEAYQLQIIAWRLAESDDRSSIADAVAHLCRARDPYGNDHTCATQITDVLARPAHDVQGSLRSRAQIWYVLLLVLMFFGPGDTQLGSSRAPLLTSQ